VTTQLRPIEEADLEQLRRFALDPEAESEFEWVGFMDPETYRRRWEKDGWIGAENTWLAVEHDKEFAGIVSFRDKTEGTAKGQRYEIGAALLPEHRGQGVGTDAHRQLVDYLFLNTAAHRLQAFTETGNVPEQRTLEKAGFQREGVMRQLFFRGGEWRDSVIYGLLRDEWKRFH
jgi:[ribosomal protein S5]-alanine N-acetyltransferase